MKALKHLFAALSLLLCSVAASAQTFEVDGLSYTVLSAEDYTVSVENGNPVIEEVVIPATVTYEGIEYRVTEIKTYGFSAGDSPTSIVIPESVTKIGEFAFYNSHLLESITFSENSQLTSIEEYAFFGCQNLQGIEIPASVTYIGPSAFSGCRYGLTSIAIPEGVTSIGGRAFADCTSLESVTIPGSVTSIGALAFSGCTSLTSITIPEGVTEIGNSAFANCTSLTSVTIPNSVTLIGDHAFADCTSLEDIPYLFSSQLTEIGDYAFYNCNSLTSIYFQADGPTRIGSSAFEGCSELSAVSIPNVEHINRRAFYNCSSLVDIFVYTTDAALIGDEAFDGTAWYNDQPDGVVYLNNNLINYKGEMPENTSIEIAEGTKTISANAFMNYTNLIAVTIPESVTMMTMQTFLGCTNLTSITCKAVTPPSMVVGSFNDYHYSTSTLYVPAAAMSAYKEADFWSAFTNIRPIESAITSLDQLSNEILYYISQPHRNNNGGTAWAVETGGTAFKSNRDLGIDLDLVDTRQQFAILQRDGGYYLYHHAEKKYITKGGGLAENPTHPIKIVASTAHENTFVFYFDDMNYINVGGQDQMTINNYSTHDGGNSCVILPVHDFDPTEALSKQIQLYSYRKKENGEAELVSVLPYHSEVTILKETYIDGERYAVTSIGDKAFAGNTIMTSVSLPTSLTAIGNAAFQECSSLTSITIPESVMTIGNDAFSNCTSLASIDLPTEMTEIGMGAFGNCTSLTSIVIPEGISDLKYWLLRECRNLTSVTLPESLEYIGPTAFSQCVSLTTIDLPQNVTSIDWAAFQDCNRLTSITIPENSRLTSIGYSAFLGCKKLTSITIPEGVTSIGESAFYNCSSLTSITIGVEEPFAIPADVFTGVNKEACKLYVPIHSYEAYKSAEVWKEFNVARFGDVYQVAYVVDGNTMATDWVTKGNPTTPREGVEKEGYTFKGWTIDGYNINIRDNADAMLYSNALCTNTSYGDQFQGWGVLFDNDANTFFHSEYSDKESADGLDHYLRVDLGEDQRVCAFSFTYTGRSGRTENNPKTIVVEGAYEADGEYSEMVILTELPTEAGAVYESGVLDNPNNYRYIRYRVTETVNNDKVKEHPYFCIAEFGMTAQPEFLGMEDPFTMPARDIVLTAVYEPNIYTVTFMHDGQVVATEEFACNAEITPAEAPTREHYTFTEWTDLPETMPAHDLVVTAKYALTLTDGQVAHFTCNKEEELTSITYNRTLLPEKRWNALYVPFEIELTEEFLTDYDVAYFNDFRCYDNDDDGAIDDMEMEVIKLKSGTLKANYPYLIRAKNDDARALNLVMADAIVYPTEVNTLTCSSVFMQFGVTGIYTRTPAESLPGCYAISSAGAWQPIAAGSNLGAFRLYLSMTTLEGSPVKVDEQSMRAIRIRTRGESEETTEIENTTLGTQEPTVIYYDLQGRRVENPGQGIYIVNGKKVIMK